MLFLPAAYCAQVVRRWLETTCRPACQSHLILHLTLGHLAARPSLPIPTPHPQGFVVGFKGSKIFCLHYVSMQVRAGGRRPGCVLWDH